MGSLRQGRALGGLAAIAVFALPAGVASAATWQIGDVFAGTNNSPAVYKVYANDGAFKEDVPTGTFGGEATGCAFDAGDNFWGTVFQANRVLQLANAHPHGVLREIDVSVHGAANPESFAFAQNGDFYVGHAGGNSNVLKFSSEGTFLDSYDVAIEARGSDWIDLAADQRTLFYTSEGFQVKRYDLVTKTQLPDFAVLPDRPSFALRLLPPGDGSGGLLVANSVNIKRLDGSGAVVGTYDAPGEDTWFGLNLDPNGTSFWSAGIGTGDIYRFNIATGAIELGPIDTGTGSVAGLCLLGELTAAVPPPVAPPGEEYKEEACGFTIKGKTEVGTDGNDDITGTAQSDHLRGASGNDKIDGLEDKDCLYGNADKDIIDGGAGGDLIRAGDGKDKVKGDDGDDDIRLQDGRDKAKGGEGDDRIKAQGQRRNEGGVDRVNCGSGDDTAIVDDWDRVSKNCEKVKVVN